MVCDPKCKASGSLEAVEAMLLQDLRLVWRGMRRSVIKSVVGLEWSVTLRYKVCQWFGVVCVTLSSSLSLVWNGL